MSPIEHHGDACPQQFERSGPEGGDSACMSRRLLAGFYWLPLQSKSFFHFLPILSLDFEHYRLITVVPHKLTTKWCYYSTDLKVLIFTK